MFENLIVVVHAKYLSIIIEFEKAECHLDYGIIQSIIARTYRHHDSL